MKKYILFWALGVPIPISELTQVYHRLENKIVISDRYVKVIEQSLMKEMAEAKTKAIDSLSRYKFAMFGYWAGI